MPSHRATGYCQCQVLGVSLAAIEFVNAAAYLPAMLDVDAAVAPDNDDELFDSYSRTVHQVATDVGRATVGLRVRGRRGQGTGSGFIVSPDGYIVTNNHVIEGADQVKVSLADKREFEAEITEQHPDERIAWRSIDKPSQSGVVTFHRLDADTTRVKLQMEYDPQGFVETAGDWLQIVKLRVRGDMERFKTFIESRGGETGAWRGDVPGPHQHGSSLGGSDRPMPPGTVGGGDPYSDGPPLPRPARWAGCPSWAPTPSPAGSGTRALNRPTR